MCNINDVRAVDILMLKCDDVWRPISLYNIAADLVLDNWSEKAKRRRTTGTGRMSYLKHVHGRFLNGYFGLKPVGGKKAATAATE